MAHLEADWVWSTWFKEGSVSMAIRQEALVCHHVGPSVRAAGTSSQSGGWLPSKGSDPRGSKEKRCLLQSTLGSSHCHQILFEASH